MAPCCMVPEEILGRGFALPSTGKEPFPPTKQKRVRRKWRFGKAQDHSRELDGFALNDG